MEQTLASFVPRNSNITLVSDLINHDTKKWNDSLLLSTFDRSLVSEIMNIRLYTQSDEKLKKDKLRWLLARNGEFSVKSLYAKLLNPSNTIPD